VVFDSGDRGQNVGVKQAVILVLGALVLLPAAYAAPARTARVAITDLAPFTVHGSGFVPGERVTVTVTAKQRVVRRAVAGARGAFTTRFATVDLTKCSAYFVRAAGSRGSVVTKKVSPQCAPPANAGGEPAPMYPTDPTPKKNP
jgi:hypothetical protein